MLGGVGLSTGILGMQRRERWMENRVTLYLVGYTSAVHFPLVFREVIDSCLNLRMISGNIAISSSQKVQRTELCRGMTMTEGGPHWKYVGETSLQMYVAGSRSVYLETKCSLLINTKGNNASIRYTLNITAYIILNTRRLFLGGIT